MYAQIKRVFEILSYLAVIIGVGIAWYEYRSQIDRTARQQSLDFVLRMHDDRIATARVAVLKPWLKYNLDALATSSASAEVVDALVLKMVDENTTDDPATDAKSSIVILTEYLDSAQACIESKVCEAKVLDQLLGDFGRSFFCLYRPVIETMRKTARLDNFGRGSEAFAARQGSCP